MSSPLAIAVTLSCMLNVEKCFWCELVQYQYSSVIIYCYNRIPDF